MRLLEKREHTMPELTCVFVCDMKNIVRYTKAIDCVCSTDLIHGCAILKQLRL